MKIEEILKKQRTFFSSRVTFDVNYRIKMLKELYHSIEKHECDIHRALKEDLGKSGMESYMCETGMTLSEISHQIKHIKKWSKTKRHRTSLANFPAVSKTVQEPYGVVLVMAPWNYPFMLCMEPLVGALAAGNCCIVKPSAYAPATSAVMKKIINEVFFEEYVAVVEGGRQENTELLNQRFDYIFFTGGVSVGKVVMEKAAAHLTPITLELGGKSPCVVEKSCDLKLTAKRIAFGKYLNCGQTCVAPDYILVDELIKDDLIKELKSQIIDMYGPEPFENSDYGKMINEKHFHRVCGLIDPDKVVYGGKWEQSALKIQPTILDNVTAVDKVMQEEIFGPVLPVITYRTIEEAEAFIQEREKPLALYLFTKNKKIQQRFMQYVSFGGGCINDTIMHLASTSMGFGGVGNSGMGSYHGKKSFDTFSHEKSILKKSNIIDMPMRYQPYKQAYLKLVKKILH